MKRIFPIAFLSMILLAVIVARLPATDFPPAQAGQTYSGVLLGPTTSNKTSAALDCEGYSTHSLQIVTTCTNAVSNLFQGTLDKTNWFPLATNAVSSSSTNAIIMIGYRVSQIRTIFTLTTANGSTNQVYYLGSRQ